MRNDNPDTIAIEDTHWVHTEVDDVFLPSVRVQLGWKDVEAAVESGAVVPQQAHALWPPGPHPPAACAWGPRVWRGALNPPRPTCPPSPPPGRACCIATAWPLAWWRACCWVQRSPGWRWGADGQLIDGLIAAAGIMHATPALEHTQEDVNKLLETNVTGVFMSAQAVARQMVKLGNGGSIVLIGSISGSITNKVCMRRESQREQAVIVALAS